MDYRTATELPVDRLKPQRLSPEELAEVCLAYLAENPELLGDFMVEAGYDPPGLRGALGSVALRDGLIDHFARHEPMILALCAGKGLRPENFMAVWQKLNRHE